jgi:hypothetical protein
MDTTSLIILWAVVIAGWIYIFVKLHKVLKEEIAHEKGKNTGNTVSHM